MPRVGITDAQKFKIAFNRLYEGSITEMRQNGTKITHADIASKLGMSRPWWVKIRKDPYKQISGAQLYILAHFFKWSGEDLAKVMRIETKRKGEAA